MNTLEDRLVALERRVGHLETWAGPGQVEALSLSLADLRSEFIGFRGEFDAFRAEISAEFSTIKADVGALKADVGDLKAGLAEVLRRLPLAG
jgi:hypothetical protein